MLPKFRVARSARSPSVLGMSDAEDPRGEPLIKLPDDGDPVPLLDAVYDELRRLAAYRMARESPGQTLQATALVHEAWLKLTKDNEQRWQNRGHFFAAAAEAMRRILIDRARRRARERHGGGLERVDVDRVELALDTRPEVLLRVNEALTKLEAQSPQRAELVKLRFFTGLQLQEAADVLGVSLATAKRHWAFARAWLLAELSEP